MLRCSQNVQDILDQMTSYNALSRPSAAELLQHPWFHHKPNPNK